MIRLFMEHSRSRALKTDVLSICVMVILLLSIELSESTISTLDDADTYLRRFGHLQEDASNSESNSIRGSVKRLSKSFVNGNYSSEGRIKAAICRFQRFSGLRETCELDAATKAKMSLSRCGVGDNTLSSTSQIRKKRFVIGSNRWPSSNLLYFYRNYSRNLDKSLIRSINVKALQMWSNVTSVTFAEALTSSQANIHFMYAVGSHGDGFPFSDNILAHTFYPNSGPVLSGDVHLNDNTQWTDGVAQGTNLLQVTTHELGHALGLGHSSDPNSVMQPFYSGYNPNFQLSQDDIKGIQSLYGDPNLKDATTTTDASVTTTKSNPTTDSQSGKTPVSPLCDGNLTIDAITTVDQTTYIFFGDQYLLLDYQTRIVAGFPRRWSDDWPGLPSNGSIDAALYLNATATKPNRLYLFSGSQYWRYSKLPSRTPDTGYPRNIAEGFPGVPDNLDAAFVWGNNNNIYFIKGMFYYRYTFISGVDAQFPKPLNLWTGFATTQTITAAFRDSDGTIYFFSGSVFYVFNEVFFKVGNALAVGPYWFGCSS